MGDAAKMGNIQVLGKKLNIEEFVRLKDRTNPAVGQLMGWKRLVLAVKNENPFCLSWLRPYNGCNSRSTRRVGGINL